MQLDYECRSARLRTLRGGAVLVADAAAVLRVEGPGALTCLQGILTGDLAAPGEDSLIYGALLTPKGMIVADVWTQRDADGLTLVSEAAARSDLLGQLARSLPPRLARVTDLSDSWSIAWLLGSQAPERLARGMHADVPGPGRVARGNGTISLAGGPAHAPFSMLLTGPTPRIQEAKETFLAAGGEAGTLTDLVTARVLAGWASLGREIDEKTLPHEVRFDENSGVSYTKGCYTGQETVARVHFRGKVNRTLRGLVMRGSEPAAERRLMAGEKEVGALGTAISLEDRVVGLGLVRREVAEGETLMAGSRPVLVVRLPIEPSVLVG